MPNLITGTERKWLNSRMIWSWMPWCSVSCMPWLGKCFAKVSVEDGSSSSSQYNCTFLFFLNSHFTLKETFGFFFKKSQWLLRASQMAQHVIHLWTSRDPVSLQVLRAVLTRVYLCACPLCVRQWTSDLWVLPFVPQLFWVEQEESEGESQGGKLQDVILKCLLLSNPTSFSAI